MDIPPSPDILTTPYISSPVHLVLLLHPHRHPQQTARAPGGGSLAGLQSSPAYL